MPTVGPLLSATGKAVEFLVLHTPGSAPARSTGGYARCTLGGQILLRLFKRKGTTRVPLPTARVKVLVLGISLVLCNDPGRSLLKGVAVECPLPRLGALL